MIARVALIFTLGCGPHRVDDPYREHATNDAIETAATEHGCPVSDVHLRCNATEPGELHDTLELDVCGEIRRYHLDDAGRFTEQPMTCGMGICAAAESGCRGFAPGAWSAQRSDPPEGCDRADVDPELAVTVEREGFVAVSLANRALTPKTRVIAGDCKHPSLMLAVDGRWYSLCGAVQTIGAIEPRATVVVRSGLQIDGRHELMAIQLDPTSPDMWDTCKRSRAIEIDHDAQGAGGWRTNAKHDAAP